MRGIFPTVHGDIHVAWQRDPDAIQLDLTVPDGTQAEIVAPAGHRLDGAASRGAGPHRVRFARL